MAVAKANVGIGGRRADGRGFRIEGAEAKVGGGRRRIGQKREQTLLKAVHGRLPTVAWKTYYVDCL